MQYHIKNTISWISPIVNSSDSALRASSFALRATTQHVGKAGGLQILCCQGIKVTDYIYTLDALALKPSGFCNVRVNSVEFVPHGVK